ncbi:hypothetical protein L3X38_009086 [Prunus dulcis]|uniref:Uncharacterized protein n=1 Tax=Prunus dulcis TaxID=3755 RepID=A0AAD5F7G5_PRUDU|nr:hypothetical protein L3X38_009086 [Prunus dulcis]
MVIRTVDVKDFSFIMMQKTKSQMQFHKGGSGSQGGSALVSRSAALINQKCHVKNKDISGSLVFGIGGQAKVAGTLFGIGGSLVFTFWKGGYLFKGFVKRPLINITVGEMGHVKENWIKGALLILHTTTYTKSTLNL